MPTNEKETGFPTPSPWLTIILSLALAFGASKYDQGKLESRVEALEKYQADDKKEKEQQRQAQQANYLAAEAERNRQKDSEVQELRQTAEQLKTLLNERNNGTQKP
jgi:hypothetical protein